MDTLLNIKAFLSVARAGSLSGAARHLGVATSVVSKRLNRLEDEMKSQLFVRSTRKMELTETGKRYIPRYHDIVSEIDEALNGANEGPRQIEGHLRIKYPTGLLFLHFDEILSDFLVANPKINLEIVLIDRSVNPIEEGFDIAFGAMPTSYAHVVNEPLCLNPMILCAAPSYLARAGEPQHPQDLVYHDCLIYHATGSHWSFDSPRGAIHVEVHSKFSANDTQILQRAAIRGLGITVSARYVLQDSLEKGLLKPLLTDFPISSLWLKALIPRNKYEKPAVQALLSWVKSRLPSSETFG